MAVVSKLNNLVELAKEKSSERRRTLLREVTDLFFEETPDSGSATSHKFDELLSSLAEQTAQDAREELSQRFADAPQAPRGLVLQLALYRKGRSRPGMSNLRPQRSSTRCRGDLGPL